MEIIIKYNGGDVTTKNTTQQQADQFFEAMGNPQTYNIIVQGLKWGESGKRADILLPKSGIDYIAVIKDEE